MELELQAASFVSLQQYTYIEEYEWTLQWKIRCHEMVIKIWS
jgi:hypothetical protein